MLHNNTKEKFVPELGKAFYIETNTYIAAGKIIKLINDSRNRLQIVKCFMILNYNKEHKRHTGIDTEYYPISMLVESASNFYNE